MSGEKNIVMGTSRGHRIYVELKNINRTFLAKNCTRKKLSSKKMLQTTIFVSFLSIKYFKTKKVFQSSSNVVSY
jgi:hypothetical protein